MSLAGTSFAAAVPVALALSIAAGLLAAFAVVALRLGVPALARVVPGGIGPVVFGVVAFLATFFTLLAGGRGGRA